MDTEGTMKIERGTDILGLLLEHGADAVIDALEQSLDEPATGSKVDYLASCGVTVWPSSWASLAEQIGEDAATARREAWAALTQEQVDRLHDIRREWHRRCDARDAARLAGLGWAQGSTGEDWFEEEG